MDKPIIGIFASPISTSSRYFEAVPGSHLNLAYSQAVIRGGGVPLILPYTADVDALLEMVQCCHGVIVPGGVDVDPHYFGEDPHAGIGAMDLVLDAGEMKALEYLYANNVPVLGICRGCQIMNIFTGGSVYQDLKTEYEGTVNLHQQSKGRDLPIHEVHLTPGSRISKLLGAERIYTNTMHHQSVKKVGAGFAVVGRTSDGVVEAIEHENGLWLATQWHPEELLDSVPAMKALFTDLVEKAKARM